MHETQTIVTDVRGVCQSVRPSVRPSICLSCGSTQRRRVLCAWGNSVQPLSNYFGLLFSCRVSLRILFTFSLAEKQAAELICQRLHQIRGGNRDSHLIQCFLGPRESSPQAGPRSVQPSLHSEAVWQTDKLAGWQTPRIIDRSSPHFMQSMTPNKRITIGYFLTSFIQRHNRLLYTSHSFEWRKASETHVKDKDVTAGSRQTERVVGVQLFRIDLH